MNELDTYIGYLYWIQVQGGDEIKSLKRTMKTCSEVGLALPPYKTLGPFLSVYATTIYDPGAALDWY